MADFTNTLQSDPGRRRAARRILYRKYAIAIGATAVAFAARVLFGAMVPKLSPFILFIPAVMLSAWFGGMGPGVLATFAGAILGNYYLLGPGHEFDTDLSASSRTFLFLFVGIQVSWLSGQMHAARRRAEADAAAARHSERLYRTLASNFPDGFVCLLDAGFRGTLAGNGLKAAGLAGVSEPQSLADHLPPDLVSQMEPLYRQTLEGRAVSADIRHQDRTYAAHFLPLPDPTSGIVCMAIFEDITELVLAIDQLQWSRDHLEQRVHERTSELHFQTTLLESQSQASLDGILALSQSGQIIFANRRFRTLWGLSDQPLTLPDVRHTIQELLVDRRGPLLFDLAADASTTAESTDELSTLDGRSFEYHGAPIVDPDGKNFGRVWFFRDITERKRLEQLLLQAGEYERQRIGQDLHDDLCQQLTGIAYAGRLLHQKLSLLPIPGELSATAANIVHLLQQANQRARDLAQGLHPIQLQRKGLDVALQDLAATVGAMCEIDCQFRGADQPLTISDAAALHLFRIAQEAISNAVRHGKAKLIRVDLVAVENRLILTIEDDGLGFPENAPSFGLGLETMSYRSRMVGGTFAIERGETRGTCVTVCVPMARGPASRPQPPIPAPT